MLRKERSDVVFREKGSYAAHILAMCDGHKDTSFDGEGSLWPLNDCAMSSWRKHPYISYITRLLSSLHVLRDSYWKEQ